MIIVMLYILGLTLYGRWCIIVKVVLKIRRKGVIILPKRLREALGVDEGDEVIVEVHGDELILRALKPRVVDVDPGIVEELLREEYELERDRYTRMVSV